MENNVLHTTTFGNSCDRQKFIKLPYDKVIEKQS